MEETVYFVYDSGVYQAKVKSFMDKFVVSYFVLIHNTPGSLYKMAPSLFVYEGAFYRDYDEALKQYKVLLLRFVDSVCNYVENLC